MILVSKEHNSALKIDCKGKKRPRLVKSFPSFADHTSLARKPYHRPGSSGCQSNSWKWGKTAFCFWGSPPLMPQTQAASQGGGGAGTRPSSIRTRDLCYISSGKAGRPMSLSRCMEHARAAQERGFGVLAVLDFLLREVECRSCYSKAGVPDARMHKMVSGLNRIALHIIRLVPPLRWKAPSLLARGTGQFAAN